MCCSSWDCKESDKSERLNSIISNLEIFSCIIGHLYVFFEEMSV